MIFKTLGLSSAKLRREAKAVPQQRVPGQKHHVRFPSSSGLIVEHIVYSAEEYDREAVKDHLDDPQREIIYRELVNYCEKEMQVHKKSKDSVKHERLRGKQQQVQAHIRVKVLEANQKLGKKVDPTALFLSQLNSKNVAHA
jgi:hypothetical protein